MQYSAARNTKGLTGQQAILLTRRFASRLPTEFYPLCSQRWNTAQFEDNFFHIVCNDVRLRLLEKKLSLTLLIIEGCPARDLLLFELIQSQIGIVIVSERLDKCRNPK